MTAALVTASAAVLGVLMVPYTAQGMRLVLAENLPGGTQQAEALVAGATTTASVWFGVVGDFVGMPIRLVVQSTFIWLLALAFGGAAKYVTMFSLTVHLNVVSQLHGWAGFLWLWARGVSAIESAADADPSLGLGLVLASDSVWLSSVYASLNPFTAWFLVLLARGTGAVSGMRARVGVGTAVTYWVATTALAGASLSFATGLLSL